MSDAIEYRTDPAEIDWETMKAVLSADGFDNGRSPEASLRGERS